MWLILTRCIVECRSRHSRPSLRRCRGHLLQHPPFPRKLRTLSPCHRRPLQDKNKAIFSLSYFSFLGFIILLTAAEKLDSQSVIPSILFLQKNCSRKDGLLECVGEHAQSLDWITKRVSSKKLKIQPYLPINCVLQHLPYFKDVMMFKRITTSIP